MYTFPINEWFVPGKPPTKSPKLPNETINKIITASIGPSGTMALSASSASNSGLFSSYDLKIMKYAERIWQKWILYHSTLYNLYYKDNF